MTPTQQLLILSSLPLSFLGMVVVVWLRGGKRRQVLYRWSATLLAAAFWASSILRFYADFRFSPGLFYYWGIIAMHAFSLAALGVLFTTLRYLFISGRSGKAALVVGAVLWVTAVALDPAFWPVDVPNMLLAGQTIRHFDWWAGIWVASWVIPLIAAWMLTEQINTSLPVSLYRNQIRYWLLVLALFGMGGALTSVHQPGQTLWQESAVLVIILAAALGTISLTQVQLPDFQIAARQIIYRLSGTLAVFALTWLALTLILRLVASLPADSEPELILLLAAAGLAAFLMIVYRLTNRLARRLFLPSAAQREAILAEYTQAAGHFPTPDHLGSLFLGVVEATVGVDDAWLFTAEDGPAGLLLLRPLAALPERELETAEFAAASPFSQHLRAHSQPLIQYDMDMLESFAPLPGREKETLNRWRRVLYVPLRYGHTLIGVAALDGKRTGEPYDHEDYAALQALCAQAGPLLAQARHAAVLQRLHEYSLDLKQTLVRQNRYLSEAVTFYSHYVDLVSPELKRPFAPIHQKLQQLQTGSDDPDKQALIAGLNQDIVALSQPIDALVNLAARVQMRRDFNLHLFHLEDTLQNALRSLQTMAEARRIKIEHDTERRLPPVLGDAAQMQEAVHNLLHNAIKFNKIGGHIQLRTGLEGSDVYLQISDTGVGIPEERLATIWQGLSLSRSNGSGKKRPGLGLALTHFIVAAHGGRIHAASQYGAGSTFTIYLPLVFENS